MFWNGIEGKELSFFLLAVIFLLMGLLDKASFFHAGVNVIKLLVFLTDSFERCISFCVSLFKRCILLVQKFLIVLAVGVPSRFMRKIVCRLRLNEISQQ